MEFRQQIIESNIIRTKDEDLQNIDIVAGERYEEKTKIKIKTSSNVNSDLIEQFVEFMKKIKMEQIFLYMDKKIGKYKDKFSFYCKYHIEKITINNLNDFRQFGYIKIVYKDCVGEVLYKEIPIFYKDCNEDILLRLDVEIDNIIRVLRKKSKKIGEMEWNDQIVIFSQQATGYFIHEVVGHLLEEDVYVYSKNYIHDIMVPNLTVVDDIRGYGSMFGLNNIDDNGVEIRPLNLIKNGKVVNTISLQNNTNGVARRTNYLQKLLPRMRCTFVEPTSKMTKSDFIRKFNNVVYVDNIFSGFCSYIDGQFSIAGNGTYIQDGMKKFFISNLLISSKIQDYLNNIIDIGNDLAIFATECSKMGHVVRVGIGGPSICFENVSVKGEAYQYGTKYL